MGTKLLFLSGFVLGTVITMAALSMCFAAADGKFDGGILDLDSM